MFIFKFGGASIKDADSIKNVASILRQHQQYKPLVVISAAGKTTNALERVLDAYAQDNGQAFDRLEEVKQFHYNIIETLFNDKAHPIYADINDIFVDIEWILEEKIQDPYDYLYDQIVSNGEFLSTKIVAAYLEQEGLTNHWLDVRDCILTDNTYRDAIINWKETTQRIQLIVPALLERGMVVTQGFLGCTSENFTTTLGREGSDFTAAIFSYALDAEKMTIWKDVPGILAGDPTLFKNPEKMDKISYREAIEMTYYGAKVIHPKTIRPLQNKNIPLYVKSFINPDGSGTVISAEKPERYPPVTVIKENQALLKLVSKDFQFVDEQRFADLFEAFANYRIKVNMTQNTALSFAVCVNDRPKRIERLKAELEELYTIEYTNNLQLVTLRHTTPEVLQNFTSNRKVVLEEHIRNTVQLVMPNTETFS